MNKSIKTTLAIGMKKDINESEIHQNLFFSFFDIRNPSNYNSVYARCGRQQNHTNGWVASVSETNIVLDHRHHVGLQKYLFRALQPLFVK